MKHPIVHVGELKNQFKKRDQNDFILPHNFTFYICFYTSVLKSKNDNPKQKFKVKGIITLLHFARKSDILVRVVKME